VHQPASLELGVGEQEPVGRHQRDLGVHRPVRQHLLQHAGGGGLAHRDGAGEPDHERRPGRLGLPQELLLGAVERARGLDVQAEQARQRQVDLLHLVEVELVTEAADPLDLELGERLVGVRAELGPGVPVELDVRRGLARVTAVRHAAIVPAAVRAGTGGRGVTRDTP
jgi:hypothetical protein